MTLTATGACLPPYSYQSSHAQFHMMQQQQQLQQQHNLDHLAHYQPQQPPMMNLRSVAELSSSLSSHTPLVKQETSVAAAVAGVLPDSMPPACACLGNASTYRYEENREGCYYTQLGVGSSLQMLRQIFEARTGVKDEALRFEKINYTTKEGKSKEGCPVAKWIIRRSGVAEKMLVIVKQRRGHKCLHAWIVVGVVVWEALDSEFADDIYDYLRVRLPEDGLVTERRCGLNEARSCACQGFDDETGGASYSFGCSWSMYSNSCKFSRTRGEARKFKLRCADNEAELQHRLQLLATVVAPLMARVVPEAYNNLVANEATAGECRLGLRPGRPFASVTACLDFATHAHRDQHNMNGGCTAVVSLTRHRGFGRPNDEQLHVLPMYTLDSTDESGTTEGQLRKVQSGALEMLSSFPRVARLRSAPLGSCNARKKAKLASNRALREAAATAAGTAAANKNREERSPSSIDSGVCVKSPFSELSPKSEPAIPSEPLQMATINTDPPSFPRQEAKSPSVLPSIESWFRKPQLKSSEQASTPLTSSAWGTQSHSLVQQMPPSESAMQPSWCRMPSQSATACGYNFNPLSHAAVPPNQFLHHYGAQIPFYDGQQPYHRFSLNNYVPISAQQHELHRQLNQQQYQLHHQSQHQQQLQYHQQQQQMQYHLQQQQKQLPYQNFICESSEELLQSLQLSQSSQQHLDASSPAISSHKPTLSASASVTNSDKSSSSLNRYSSNGQKRPSNDGTTGVDQEYLTDNEEIFLDAEIGGVGIALAHGSIMFEVAKKELHSTTSVRVPNRRLPSRISIIFYQHKNLHFAHHGFYEEEKRKEKRRAVKEAETAVSTSPSTLASPTIQQPSQPMLPSATLVQIPKECVPHNVHPSYSAVLNRAPQSCGYHQEPNLVYDYPQVKSSSSFCQAPMLTMTSIKEEKNDLTFIPTVASQKSGLDLASISVDSLLDESPLTSLSHSYINNSSLAVPEYFY